MEVSAQKPCKSRARPRRNALRRAKIRAKTRALKFSGEKPRAARRLQSPLTLPRQDSRKNRQSQERERKGELRRETLSPPARFPIMRNGLKKMRAATKPEECEKKATRKIWQNLPTAARRKLKIKCPFRNFFGLGGHTAPKPPRQSAPARSFKLRLPPYVDKGKAVKLKAGNVPPTLPATYFLLYLPHLR